MHICVQLEPRLSRGVANNNRFQSRCAVSRGLENSPPMLRHSDGAQGEERPEFRTLLEQLAADGRSWADAELALAKVEMGELRRQAVKALVLLMLGFSAVFSSLVVLSQAGVAFLTPYVGSAEVAALIVGVGLLLLVGVLLLVMRNAFTWRAESIFFRWFGQKPSSGPRS